MRYFKKQNGSVHAVDEGQEHIIKPEWVEITEAEMKALTAPSAEQVLANKIAEAQAYLSSTDWITAKYHDEVIIAGSMSKADFIAKYQEIYDKRAEKRSFINENEV